MRGQRHSLHFGCERSVHRRRADFLGPVGGVLVLVVEEYCACARADEDHRKGAVGEHGAGQLLAGDAFLNQGGLAQGEDLVQGRAEVLGRGHSAHAQAGPPGVGLDEERAGQVGFARLAWNAGEQSPRWGAQPGLGVNGLGRGLVQGQERGPGACALVGAVRLLQHGLDEPVLARGAVQVQEGEVRLAGGGDDFRKFKGGVQKAHLMSQARKGLADAARPGKGHLAFSRPAAGDQNHAH